MGKTLVARSVIAGAIERLQHDDTVDRIDIIYICSNADIARQNIAKLDVRGDGTKPLSTRITMLATQLRDLNRTDARWQQDGEPRRLHAGHLVRQGPSQRTRRRARPPQLAA